MQLPSDELTLDLPVVDGLNWALPCLLAPKGLLTGLLPSVHLTCHG